MGLFKPTWMSDDWVKAENATERITDQKTLATIAQNAPCYQARKKAVHKILDQSLLLHIAKNDNEPIIRGVAIGSLTEQSELMNIIDNEKELDLIKYAMRCLKEQSFLVKIAKTHKHFGIRQAAVDMLTDPNLLANIALGNDKIIAEYAKKKLIDNPPKNAENMVIIAIAESVIASYLSDDSITYENVDNESFRQYITSSEKLSLYQKYDLLGSVGAKLDDAELKKALSVFINSIDEYSTQRTARFGSRRIYYHLVYLFSKRLNDSYVARQCLNQIVESYPDRRGTILYELDRVCETNLICSSIHSLEYLTKTEFDGDKYHTFSAFYYDGKQLFYND